MDAKQALEKLASAEAVKELIGAEGLKALSAMVGSVEALETKANDAEAKAGRILDEKKSAQEKATTLEGELKALKESGMSEAEKSTQANKDILARLEAAEATNKSLLAETAKATRTSSMDKIAGGLKFIDQLAPGAGRTLIESALSGVEDLSNEADVKAAMDGFRESNKAIIAAESQARGGGSERPDDDGKGGKSDEISTEEREKQLQEMKII